MALKCDSFCNSIRSDISTGMLSDIYHFSKSIFKNLKNIENENMLDYFGEILSIQSDSDSLSDIFEKYVKYRQIDYSLLDWSEDPTKFPKILKINKIENLKIIRKSWRKIISENQFPDFIKEDNIFKWNEKIILKEISDLENRLFVDIGKQKLPLIQLREFRKIVQRRKKAKTDWTNTFNNNLSIGNDQINRFLYYYLIEILKFSKLNIFCHAVWLKNIFIDSLN